MGHIVAGFPTKESSIKAANGIIKGGANYLEVQFPFSDPSADGVIIQNACDLSLKNGFSVSSGFEMLMEIKETKIIIVAYINTIFKFGVYEFVARAKECGVYGIIVPDLPLDSNIGFVEACLKSDVAVIPLITPNTPLERMKQIVQYGSEIVYVVARRGITGDTTNISKELLEYISNVRKNFNGKLAVGFGINSKTQIEALRQVADIAVVGSYFVGLIEKYCNEDLESIMMNKSVDLIV